MSTVAHPINVIMTSQVADEQNVQHNVLQDMPISPSSIEEVDSNKIPENATLHVISADDFSKLPKADQEALISQGYDLRGFHRPAPVDMFASLQAMGALEGEDVSGQSMMISARPAFYIVKYVDESGQEQFMPLRNVFRSDLTEDQYCSEAAYHCELEQLTTGGGQPVAGDQSVAAGLPPITQRSTYSTKWLDSHNSELPGGNLQNAVAQGLSLEDIQNYKAHQIIQASEVELSEIVQMLKNGWHPATINGVNHWVRPIQMP